MSASPFTQLGLATELVHAVHQQGYDTATPIQTQAIPPILQGRDVIGCAQTGTGKTAAFVLPMLQRLRQHGRSTGRGPAGPSSDIRALVVTPTRELAAQIGERAAAYGERWGLRHTVIYGGVPQCRQEIQLRNAPELLVATPGRLLDLMNQGIVRLRKVEILILDEADTMLDMGFIHDIRKIVAVVPKERQTLLFSATMPPPILQLAKGILRQPTEVSVAPAATTAETIDQSVYHVSRGDKRDLLQEVLSDADVKRALVFTRTKRGANRVAEQLARASISAAAIHGNKSQNARERSLESFRSGETKVLVATDIAARGIDVAGVSHVVNYELPNVAESYVHRIGRTGRAGALGRAIAFCDAEERPLLRDIEHLIRRRIPILKSRFSVEPGAPSGESASPPGSRPEQRRGSRPSPSGGQRDPRSRGPSGPQNRRRRPRASAV